MVKINKVVNFIFSSMKSPSYFLQRIDKELGLTEFGKVYHKGERAVIYSLYDALKDRASIYSYELVAKLGDNTSDILDLGCGPGHGTFLLSLHTKGRVIGVDYSKVTIDFAKKNYQNSNLLYLQLNALDIDILPKFDVICCIDILEHLDEEFQSIFIKKVYNLLKKNGKLLLHTTNKDEPDPLIHHFHKHEFTLNELQKFLRKNTNGRVKISRMNILGKPLKEAFVAIVERDDSGKPRKD